LAAMGKLHEALNGAPPATKQTAWPRAERRLGEMMREQARTVGLNAGGGDRKSEEYHRGISDPSDPRPTLASQGIDNPPT
jgi:hypothetical protein